MVIDNGLITCRDRITASSKYAGCSHRSSPADGLNEKKKSTLDVPGKGEDMK